MNKSMKIILVIVGILIILAIPVSGYNSLVSLEQKVDSASSNIDTQLQRRSDLIPNLVSTVKGYATQEKTIFADIANARSKLAGATNTSDIANADSALSGALSRLIVIEGNYPDL